METLENNNPVPAFASLSQPQDRWGSFGIGYVGQVVLAVLIAKSGISFVAPVIHPVDTRDSVHLVLPQSPPPPPVAKLKELPIPKPAISPRRESPSVNETPPQIELPKQRVEVAKVTPPTLPAPLVKTDTFRKPDLAVGPKVPRAVVATNFGGSSARPTENKPARQVQTGGFGDPNGVPANPNSTGKGPVIAKVGSFDLPGGPGTGNGTGGSTGVRGTVASAGFGNGIAIQGEGGTGSSHGSTGVRSANFGSVVQPAPVPPRQQGATPVSKDTPVSLISKPMPTYTSEARQRKIEGDVELDVEFTAAGQVHVLHVLQGLGYGLDEAAVKAAESIRFSPARHNGQPVDAHGYLRIVFRLS
jgi:TonB family protein